MSTQRHQNAAVCPYCPATFGATDRWPAADLLADHVTDAHQDKLPKFNIGGGE